MSLPRILIIKAGSTDPAVQQRHGDYDAWFQASLVDGVERCDVVSAFEGETLPHPGGYGGILITGSPLSVRDEAPWMPALARWALRVADFGTPLLGVCFGHQLLGETLGGRVERDPSGGEYGSIEITLTPEGKADPLFEGLPEQLSLYAMHGDLLVRAPTASGVERLAGNDGARWQAFAAGPNVRAVQFHPEVSAEALAMVLARRGIEATVHSTSHGAKILDNWDRSWVRRDQ